MVCGNLFASENDNGTSYNWEGKTFIFQEVGVPRMCGFEYQPLNPMAQGGNQQLTVGFSVHAKHAQKQVCKLP